MTSKTYTVDDKKRACIVLAVLHYISVLNAKDEKAYWETYHQWTEHRWDDPAWSEGFSHRIPGVTGPAFQSACQKIAALAYCPGGVRIFGTWFVAKHQPDWCAWSIWSYLGRQALNVIRDDFDRAVSDAKSANQPKDKKKRAKKSDSANIPDSSSVLSEETPAPAIQDAAQMRKPRKPRAMKQKAEAIDG